MLRKFIHRAAAIALGAVAIATLATPGAAQPAPSFLATCDKLRSEIDKLDLSGDPQVVIEVVGQLTMVRSDGALVYLVMCEPPNPRVVCVTYETNGRKAGDEAILTGNYIPRGPDHIQLDPCLHHPPE